MNRQQRRYEEDSGYRHIQIDLEDTKDSFDQYNKKIKSNKDNKREMAIITNLKNEYGISNSESKNAEEVFNVRYLQNKSKERYGIFFYSQL